MTEIVEFIKVDDKLYRPFTYEEAKKKLLGNVVTYKCETRDEVCCHCDECEDAKCAKDNIKSFEESYIITTINEEYVVVDNRKVDYLSLIELFVLDNNKPAGVEVKVTDAKSNSNN